MMQNDGLDDVIVVGEEEDDFTVRPCRTAAWEIKERFLCGGQTWEVMQLLSTLPGEPKLH